MNRSRILVGIVALVLACEAFAQQLIFFPPPRLVVQDVGEPMQIQSMDINASIRGLYATVDTTLVFSNPNKGRELEGELIFPLPDGAAVCGYALDIGGAMVDGVVVPKEVARVAFETETRRRVDPGLVEHVKGNVYRTRVYPLPAGGTRTIRLRYVTPLAMAPNGDAALALPMPREPIGRRTVAIDVVVPDAVAPQLGGLGDHRFAQADNVWRVAVTDRDVTPGADVFVALPALPAAFATLEKAPDGTVWFMASAMAPVAKTAQQKGIPSSIDIVWDASGSRAEHDVAADLALIAALPKEITHARLFVFRDTPEAAQTFATRDALLAALRAVTYDGGTDFTALTAALPRDGACRLVFTDGLDTLCGTSFSFDGGQTTVIVSSAIADRETLRQACGGALIDLQTTDVATAAALIFAPQPRVTGVAGGAVRNVQGIGRAAHGRVTVTGVLAEETATIRIDCGVAGETAPMVLRSADAREGKTLATAWAAARVAQLAPNADAFADELLTLGRTYGVVSPVTSLLVLERLDQWVRHKIEPPATQPQLREQWQAEMKRRGTMNDDRQARHLEQLVKAWQARVAWWTRDYEKEPLKPEGVNQNQGGAMVMSLEDASVAPAANVESEALGATPRMNRMRMSVQASSSAGSAKSMKKDSTATPAAIHVQAWSPDTPYLAAMKASPADAYAKVYGEQRKTYMRSPGFYLDCAGFFFDRGERVMGLRVLSNLVELRIEDPALLRVYAWRLRQAGDYDRAVAQLRRVIRMRGEDPQSYRDLALVLAERGKAARSRADLEEAMTLLKRVAMTPWERHALSIGLFALEELNALVAWIDAQTWQANEKPEVPAYDEQLKQSLDVDVRIIMSWDMDATDIDLHVIEPSKEEAYYGHNRTTRGGLVSNDVTDGYGPEEYMIRKAPHGKYEIRAKYFASHQQTVVGPATVTATIFTHWGRANESQQTMSLRLDKQKDQVSIGIIQFGEADAGAPTPEACAELKVGLDQAAVTRLLGAPAGTNATEWTYLKDKRTVVLTFDAKGLLVRGVEKLPGGVTTILVQ